MADGLDLNQLQAQLELKRSALADSILSKLPGLGGASASSSATAANPPPQHQQNARPRQANLGVGATPKQLSGDQAGNNSSGNNSGEPRSAADVRLKGALSAKRKRWQDEEPKVHADTDSEDEEASRADAISATKKAKQSNGSTNSSSTGASGKPAKKDPFAAKGIEAQRAAQNQPRIVVVDGETIDLSKLSKTQRKKINKQLKAQEQQQQQQSTVNDDVQEASVPIAAATPTKQKPSAASPSKAVPVSSSAGSGTSALTPLQAQMLSKLSGSRFRTINEKLYTTASDEAVRMIDAAPAMFDEYHQGFREQVRSWPKNPLDRIVELFDPSLSSGKAKTKSKANQPRPAAGAAKARFTPGALVVDLGAGEGGLAKKLAPKGVKVLCYDLVTTSDGWVRKQDTAAIGGLPLPGYFDENDALGLQVVPDGSADGVADVAVFCLSLMGTNWIHMLLEAKRVLRTGGELIIAEVSSRFADGFDAFIRIVKMLGFGLEHKDATNTHFVLFEFVKLSHQVHLASLSSTADQDAEIDPHSTSLDELAAHGKTLLKPCIYKRR
ncbi:related to RRP8-nucleolar protein required for efficient processing of pre-rRNA at site A2 [Sporisorium reilianum f. sp. reilianum]|uniref:Ribosomal RNA-processing protein 8 n=1 Tax=Sporisorium reilianum f. sp. reilianum TaxID=72559 RepID=A0A2N8UJJ0_9BASI|nr:related to RRP8-nucleolar protein required for efficient processing of pre-rRNA at site A2 [Sporisorium reilianum f. sp. reilianum]